MSLFFATAVLLFEISAGINDMGWLDVSAPSSVEAGQVHATDSTWPPPPHRPSLEGEG